MATTVIVFDHLSGDDTPQCIETFDDLQTAREGAAMYMEDACGAEGDCSKECMDGHCPFEAGARALLAGALTKTVDGFQVTIYPGLDGAEAEGRFVIERLDAAHNHLTHP